MAAFPDYKSPKAFAEERRGPRFKVAHCGNMEWVRLMEVKRWPKQIPEKGYMGFRLKEEDYLVRHHGQRSGLCCSVHLA